MPDLLLAARPSGTTTGPEVLHIVCCDDDTALCGEDVSGEDWSDRGEVCTRCEVEWAAGGPCPVARCVRGQRSGAGPCD
jgi:hypothetical protein